MATWVKVFHDGRFTHQWKCSGCGNIWEVHSILTPLGLGYKTCPECDAQMTGIGEE